MEDYSEAKELVPFGQTPMESDLDDEIKLYKPKKKVRNRVLYSACLRVWRFLLLVVAFFLVYYCLYQLYLKNAKVGEDIPASVVPEQSTAEETTSTKELLLPFIIDESGTEFDFEALFYEDSLFRLPSGNGIKVIIVNSHSSENVSKNATVADLSEDLFKILQSKGISAYLDKTEYDADGTIGAYTRMSENVASLKEKYNDVLVVVDLHDSDIGVPFVFTVGISDHFAWQENMRFACNIYKLMKFPDGTFRMLPSSLGQDSGLLSINIGIGGITADDVETRAILSSFADALVAILQEEPLAQTRGSFLYSL